MEKTPQVLICDDDSTFQLAVKTTLKSRYHCRTAYNTDEACAVIRNYGVDVVILDVQMRTPDEGLRGIPRLLEIDPEVSIIMSTGLSDFTTVREAMKLGAADYVPKDFNPEELIHSLERIIRIRELARRRDQQTFEVAAEQRKLELVGTSAGILSVRKMVERFRSSNANVLITGETGTGKEIVARSLRKHTSSGFEPFVAVDSSTIQSTMAESILFGHERGAFTGADRSQKGIFEEASGGIVYFDELANMPLEIQPKLLRAIQEKEITRLGSARPIQLDFRVVCATNRDLEQMARMGTFKEDLFQRLNVLPIFVPPLRERREDIPALIAHFVTRKGFPKSELKFTEEAIKALQNHDWPGNIRELQNTVEYVATLAEGMIADFPDLPPRLREFSKTGVKQMGQDFYSRVEQFEKSLLSEEYSRCGGNISKLAVGLGMDRSHLYTKLRQYGLHQPKG
ncbi:MAG: sigma-54-dependent transcriptional regulator [Bdellovibrionota bacterium]